MVCANGWGLGGCVEPGRELDALVAEKVMGLTAGGVVKRTFRDPVTGVPTYATTHNSTPQYSTDIAAAWKIVEKLSGEYYDGIEFTLIQDKSANYKHVWWAGFGRELHPIELGPSKWRRGDTAPYAICLAALQSVGHPIHPVPPR
jgi:hypothetical protein